MERIFSLPAYFYNKLFSTQRESDLNTYFSKGHKLLLTDKDITSVCTDVSNLENLKRLLAENGINTFLIGGSYGLRLFTEKNFPTNDIDVFCPVLSPTSSKYDNFDLRPETAVLAKLYKGITVKLAKDHYKIVDGVKVPLSVVTDADGTEQFDDYIVGTLNIVADGKKLQFVFVNVESRDIEKWYMSASDLPTCITFDPFQTYFGIGNIEKAKSSLNGVLTGIKHEPRRIKYTEKGFVCPNPFQK
jgi:hypothetical protein